MTGIACRGKHKYLFIYSFELKSAFDVCQLLLYVAKRYILQQARRCKYESIAGLDLRLMSNNSLIQLTNSANRQQSAYYVENKAKLGNDDSGLTDI